MDASTCYGILTHYSDRYRYDYEKQYRFYKKKSKKLIPPHRLNFMVVRKSMQIRYFMEMTFFFLLACLFQYEVYEFAKYYNEWSSQLKELKKEDANLDRSHAVVFAEH